MKSRGDHGEVNFDGEAIIELSVCESRSTATAPMRAPSLTLRGKNGCGQSRSVMSVGSAVEDLWVVKRRRF